MMWCLSWLCAFVGSVCCSFGRLALATASGDARPADLLEEDESVDSLEEKSERAMMEKMLQEEELEREEYARTEELTKQEDLDFARALLDDYLQGHSDEEEMYGIFSNLHHDIRDDAMELFEKARSRHESAMHDGQSLTEEGGELDDSREFDEMGNLIEDDSMSDDSWQEEMINARYLDQMDELAEMRSRRDGKSGSKRGLLEILHALRLRRYYGLDDMDLMDMDAMGAEAEDDVFLSYGEDMWGEGQAEEDLPEDQMQHLHELAE
eukprot:TRINITY_DN30436_c0_g1_i2.p1 TRINITY_DN30436_c0_g1~~TRINITY_DN30436_c0_g1_i2.p1  ORF type:complete len:266 (-),score=88.62 TRINITY_DN30436_c0_g1_i2:552-1349(-)